MVIIMMPGVVVLLSETRMRFRSVLSSMTIRRLRRRREIIFWNISESIRVSDFKIYHMSALDSVDISTGNDVINYFRSEANRTNVEILGHVRVAISR